jgi:hypothetical protein
MLSPEPLEKLLKAHATAAKLLERESCAVALRDSFVNMLIGLACASQFGATVESLQTLGIRSSFNVTLPLIRHHRLLLNDVVPLKLFRDSKDGPADLPLASEQLRVALFGDSGSGKTHLVQTLVRAVIQFHSGTDGATSVGALEIDRNGKEVQKAREPVQDFSESLILSDNPHRLSLALVAAAFSANDCTS